MLKRANRRSCTYVLANCSCCVVGSSKGKSGPNSCTRRRAPSSTTDALPAERSSKCSVPNVRAVVNVLESTSCMYGKYATARVRSRTAVYLLSAATPMIVHCGPVVLAFSES